MRFRTGRCTRKRFRISILLIFPGSRRTQSYLIKAVLDSYTECTFAQSTALTFFMSSIGGTSIDGGLWHSPTPKISHVHQLLLKLGKRIRALRLDRGWTQEELAHRSGLNRSYMSDVENGRSDVSLSTLHKIARPLEISLAELLAGIG
jgi:DNA-binding XRE family transcriptional regulator